MANKPKYTVEQVQKALEKSAGVLAVAAKKLGCSRQTIENYVIRHPELAETKLEARETILDLCEANWIELIRQKDKTAMIWYEKTRGKHRGLTERQEITGKDGRTIPALIINIGTDADAEPPSKAG